MRIFLLALAAAIILPAVSTAAESASTILASVRKKMLATPGVEALFTINGESGPSQGRIDMQGKAFALTTPAVSVWYDGKTQWTLVHSSNEVSITEPEPDEVSTMFPILSDPESHYTSRRLSDIRGKRRVELVPKNKELGIKRYVVHIDPATSWPTAIVAEFEGGRRMDIVVDSMKGLPKREVSLFRYDTKKFPAMEIIDLR